MKFDLHKIKSKSLDLLQSTVDKAQKIDPNALKAAGKEVLEKASSVKLKVQNEVSEIQKVHFEKKEEIKRLKEIKKQTRQKVIHNFMKTLYAFSLVCLILAVVAIYFSPAGTVSEILPIQVDSNIVDSESKNLKDKPYDRYKNCVARGTQYYKEIESYPRLRSTGEYAEEKISNICEKNDRAF